MKPKQQNEKQQKNRRKKPKQEILQQMKAKQKKRSTANLEITEENINTKNIEEPKYIFYIHQFQRYHVFKQTIFPVWRVFFSFFFQLTLHHVRWRFIRFIRFLSRVSSLTFSVSSKICQKGWLQIGASVPQQLRCSERSFTDSIYPWTFPLTSSRQKRTRCCHLGFPKKQSTKKPKEHETWKTQKKET